MRDPERMPSALEELEGVGVGAHIDDFGTGYSSLTFLRHFAGNTLKMDRSFIASICERPWQRRDRPRRSSRSRRTSTST